MKPLPRSGLPLSPTDSTVIKIAVLGDGGVGKSAVTIQFITGAYVGVYDPTIEDHYRKTVEVDGKSAMVLILDTAGQEGFESIRDSWIRSSHAQMVVFSLSSKKTLSKAEDILQEIDKLKRVDSRCIVLCGNKSDLMGSEREVQADEGKAVANAHGALYYECSAKTKENVEQMFFECIRLVEKDRAHRLTQQATVKKSFCYIL